MIKGYEGYDVSHHNGAGICDMVSLKEFVFVKVTEGKNYRDPMFKTHVEKFRKAGYRIGVYHFVRHDTGNSPYEEMSDFLKAVDETNPEYIALDIEGASLSRTTAETWMKDAVKYIRERTSLPLLIYVQGSAVRRFSFLCREFENVKIWLADWTSKSVADSASRFDFDIHDVAVWQTGSIKSILGSLIDSNICVETFPKSNVELDKQEQAGDNTSTTDKDLLELFSSIRNSIDKFLKKE